MPYESVDHLQRALAKNVFGYAKDSKKAAGRALGTIVEIITFYLLKFWGLGNAVAIERRIPEFGNPSITHNVEYSLHPVLAEYVIELENDGKSLTANRLLKKLLEKTNPGDFERVNHNLLSRDGILRNACTIGKAGEWFLVASLLSRTRQKYRVAVVQQSVKPYAIIECKRVGVEKWFNVITPQGGTLDNLKDELRILRQKNWREILQ